MGLCNYFHHYIIFLCLELVRVKHLEKKSIFYAKGRGCTMHISSFMEILGMIYVKGGGGGGSGPKFSKTFF